MNESDIWGNIKALDFDSTLSKILGSLTLLSYQAEPTLILSKHMDKIRSSIIAGDINTETMQQESSNCVTRSKSIAPYKTYIKHACIYTELAKNAKGNANERDAWSFISQASYLVGLAQGGITSYQGADEGQILQDKARKASLAGLNTKFAQDRKVVIRLLQKPPIEGWSSEREAFNSIKVELRDIIIASLKSIGGERLKLDPDKFETQVMGWIRHNKRKATKNEPQGEVRQVYEIHSKFRRANPNNYS